MRILFGMHAADAAQERRRRALFGRLTGVLHSLSLQLLRLESCCYDGLDFIL